MTEFVLYDDGHVMLDAEGLTIRHYYVPFGNSKEIPYSQLRGMVDELAERRGAYLGQGALQVFGRTAITVGGARSLDYAGYFGQSLLQSNICARRSRAGGTVATKRIHRHDQLPERDNGTLCRPKC